MRTRILWLALLAAPLCAQTAGINGVVTDSTQALVPGARITITSLETGLRREVETNEVGYYSIPLLPIGRYRATASKEGFGPAEWPEFKLDVQQVARIDFTIKPGALSESVSVSATAALLDSETTSVGQVIDNKRIVEMPLNGRNYLQLAQLAAGVVPQVGKNDPDEGFAVASGQHGFQMNISLDGVDNTSVAPIGFLAQAARPSIDAVSEFRVITNNLSAEYGYRMGGHIFVTVKSGTNQWHGTAFEFLRNDTLDGSNFFANRAGSQKPAYRQNQFGGTLGGPLKRDKTFLFGSFEGTRIRLGRSFITTVPTQPIRDGNFAGVRPVFDPATTTGTGGAMRRQAFPNNIIPRDRWDPLYAKLVSLYPLPTDPTKIVNNHYWSPTEKNDSNSYDLKGDQNVSDAIRLSMRYSKRDKGRRQHGSLPFPADGGASTTDVANHSGVISYTHTLTPSLTNELRFGYTRIFTEFDIAWDKSLFEEYGIKGIPKTATPSSNDRGLPLIQLGGYAQFGAPSSYPNVNTLDHWQLNDVAFKNVGKHLLKFGFELRNQKVFRTSAVAARGSFTFNREFTADPQNRAATGDGMAEFMLGTASNGWLSNERGEAPKGRTFAAYLQDDFKITPRLTLNLGVRYDLFFTPTFDLFPGGGVNNFLLDYTDVGPNARLKEVRPKNSNDCMCEEDFNNIAPRVGLAYRWDNKTVVRAAFGIVYGQADFMAMFWARLRNQAPDWVSYVFPTVDRITPSIILKNGFPPVPMATTEVPGPTKVAVISSQEFLPAQYSNQWFFDLQRELPGGIMTTIGYAGNGTRKMLADLDYSLPRGPSSTPVAQRRLWPYYVNVTRSLPMISANYNALTWKAEKRFARGFQFLSSFTWSHAMDNGPEPLINYSYGGSVDPWNRGLDRASSIYDVRFNYVFSSTFELPFGKGKRWLNRGGLLDAVLGGWQLGGIFSARTGTPFTVSTSGGLTNAGGADRPNRLRHGDLPAGQRSIDRWFDVGAFQVQPQYTYGNSGRNILFGPGMRNVDAALAKSFRIDETKRLQFRFESFNFTNTPAFGVPASTINTPGAGMITTAGEPRRIQFALKFVM